MAGEAAGASLFAAGAVVGLAAVGLAAGVQLHAASAIVAVNAAPIRRQRFSQLFLFMFIS